MPLLFAIVAGIVPMLIYPLFLYWMDRYEKEPLALVVAAFVWGFIPAAIFALVSQFLLDIPLYLAEIDPASADLFATVFSAPLTEELFKGMAVFLVYMLWRREFDGVLDGIIYGGLVGFGFAAIENIFYFLDADVTVVLLRAVVFGLNHAFFTSLTGIGFGVARHARSSILRFFAPLIGLAAAMTAHGLHNLTVSLVSEAPALLCLTFLADWGGVLFVFGVMLYSLRREHQWLVNELRDEVSTNTLTQSQYQISSSAMRRFGTLLDALVKGGPQKWRKVGRYFDTLTELAYKKHAFNRRGEAGASQTLIDRLRTRASLLSMEMADVVH